MENSPDILLHTMQGAADMLSCSARTIKRMVERGDLASVQLTDDPRSIRVPTKSLVDYVDKGVSECHYTSAKAARSGAVGSSTITRSTSSQPERPQKRGPQRLREERVSKQKADKESQKLMRQKPTVTH